MVHAKVHVKARRQLTTCYSLLYEICTGDIVIIMTIKIIKLSVFSKDYECIHFLQFFNCMVAIVDGLNRVLHDISTY